MEKLLGEVTHYFTGIGVGVVKLKGEIKVGDKLHFKGTTTDFVQKLTSMQVDYKNIEKAKKGMEVGIKVEERVREGDKVYLVSKGKEKKTSSKTKKSKTTKKQKTSGKKSSKNSKKSKAKSTIKKKGRKTKQRKSQKVKTTKKKTTRKKTSKRKSKK